MIPLEPPSASGVLRAGFIPLLDAAPLIVASELPFAKDEGIGIELMRETSWATLRDRLAVGHLDAAHILAPLAIADSLRLTPLPVGLVVPMTLGTAGNTITVSRAIQTELARHGADGTLDPQRGARAFASLVAERRGAGREPLTLAIVHACSAHHYQLAYWLGSAGVRPGVDVDLVVIPPSLMTAALESARIDGFCVGEPWGSAAALGGSGHVVTTSAQIWHRGPDKVLGVRRAFAVRSPEATAALIRAVYRAACWCEDAANQDALATLLSRPDLIGQPVEVIRQALARRSADASNSRARENGFLSFAANGATYPRRDHAAWFFAQMVRWGQVQLTAANIDTALSTYAPGLFETALGTSAPIPPGTPSPEMLFDGTPFDPARIAEYISGFTIRARDIA